ncbi:endonuclease/exonuclease/phosphatase family protein [Alistipes senegalensis]|uniref:endonuclease/exonuclease/phosphatase family protein n=1 Tax=Alistipes senegalensis TaxID=1288121 RepID=UPI002430851A|nr:endonuclease/exonuclease/phosphatase family protein [Alistipes senegalensis]MCI7307293.1 endonuclease/exonuclease/phosphatase family protein [Alistipes senegalensis]MDD7039295.1 endonuclease/exonuclease/phosphatase family protein [Alistipes senegalensis]MDY2875925.1 endonuclease/exonuclease/phosphatase family protein [Alistipes senegalensis]
MISFNIRVDNAADGTNVWRNRRDAVVTMIERERPMLLGFQEAQPHQITYLSEHCPDYAWYGLGRDTGKVPPATDSYAAEETMAIFWRTAELELLDKGTFWLSETPDQVSKGWDASYRRTCTWAGFRHKKSGQTCYFFNTHLDNDGKVAREESIKLLVSRMKTINSKRRVSFLTADFNSNVTDACFAPLHVYMRDARANAAVSDDYPSWNGYGASTGRLDHVFFSGDNCTAREFRTLRGDYGVPYISDHYPVAAWFRCSND